MPTRISRLRLRECGRPGCEREFETTPRWRFFCGKCRKNREVLKGLGVTYGFHGARTAKAKHYVRESSWESGNGSRAQKRGKRAARIPIRLSRLLQAQSSGESALPGATAALEACSGFVSRAFASADVTMADSTMEGVLDPSTLGQIGRALIRVRRVRGRHQNGPATRHAAA